MISTEIRQKYLPSIGIECHVQLDTKTKLFSGAGNDARDVAPNTLVSPICFGLPGTLPVLNRRAVELAVKAGLALGCDIAEHSYFERKHYFYPDLPKGYQISQLAAPTIGSGAVTIRLENGQEKSVRIHHAHIEEDAGKLTHPAGADFTLVDLNRAGTPLIEIVSEPDMHSPEDAKAYAQELYLLMTYAGVTRGDLYHGNMRFDVNVSVSQESGSLGTRTETKNLNSFKAVERAVEFEINRQIELLEKGERIAQETRGWNEARQATFSQRSKENAHDYRYFPDADLPPIYLSDEFVETIRLSMPKLPAEYRVVFEELELDISVQTALLASRTSSDLVMRLHHSGDNAAARRVALWFTSAVVERLDEDAKVSTNSRPIPDEYFAELSLMVEKDELSSTAAKEVFNDMLRTSAKPHDIAERKNLLQNSDEDDIAAIVEEVLADPANAAVLDDIRGGNERAIGFLVGQIMKKTSGKANPALAQKLIRNKL